MTSRPTRLTLSIDSYATPPAPTEAEHFVPVALTQKPAATEARIRVEMRQGRDS
jgi:hypothetical protein